MNNNQSVTVIAVTVILAVAALLIFQPDNPNVSVLLGFAGVLITQVMANRHTDSKIKEVTDKVEGVTEKVDGVHTIVNSRMTELLETVGKASKAEGVLEGKAEPTKEVKQSVE